MALSFCPREIYTLYYEKEKKIAIGMKVKRLNA